MEYGNKSIDPNGLDPLHAIRYIAQNTLENFHPGGRVTPNDILNKAHSALSETLHQATRVIQIIDHLRALKPGRKQHEKACAVTQDAVQHVLDMMQDEAPLSGITVLKILPGDLSPAPLRPADLEAVLSQTIFYYRSRLESIQKCGTGMINIEAGEKNYISSENSGQKRFILRVSHNGPEIDRKDLPDLFDAFCSSAPNGLGLYLCRKITDYYGGTIQVETNSRATIFQFEFPN